MIRPAPRSTLFPYTTLIRSIRKSCGKKKMGAPRVVICVPCEATEVEKRAVKDAAINAGAKKVFLIEEPRSEEHRSELQSRQYIVCRLLLVKTSTLIP